MLVDYDVPLHRAAISYTHANIHAICIYIHAVHLYRASTKEPHGPMEVSAFQFVGYKRTG